MIDLTDKRAIIFDLDDTLYSRREAAKRTFPGMLRELLYINRSEEFITEAVELMMSKVSRNSMVHEGVFSALTEAYPTDKPFSREACLDYYYEHISEFAELFPGTRELLMQLRERGMKIGVLTNITSARLYSQKMKIDALGLEALADDIIYSGEVGIHKPDRRLFDLAAERLGVKNEECVFVGDDPESDVRGALGADMDVFFVDRFSDEGFFTGEPRVARIGSLNEILN